MRTAELVEDLDHFLHRVIQDALSEQTRSYWVRRAEAFEWAATERPGDYLGQATETERDARIRRMVDAAAACRNRAALCDVEDWLPSLEPELGRAA